MYLQPFIMPAVKRLDWSPKKRATAITLQKEGYSYREIAAKIGQGVSPAGVLKVCKRFAETGTIKNKAGRGRKKVTTPQTDRRIVRLALRNRKSTSVDINNALADSGVAVSGRTVRRRLVSAGLRARIPRKKPFLNPAQRLKRLQWGGPRNMSAGPVSSGRRFSGVMRHEFQSLAAMECATFVADLERTACRSVLLPQ